jgi:hypothetical protein
VVWRVHVDDPVNRLLRVGRVQRRQHEVAGVTVWRSRISPMKITSGSWRATARSAVEKSCVSTPTSRWSMMASWSRCSTSIGSSMVTMWPWGGAQHRPPR